MVKIVLRERESAQEAVRRLRKILERSGLKRELRRRESRIVAMSFCEPRSWTRVLSS